LQITTAGASYSGEHDVKGCNNVTGTNSNSEAGVGVGADADAGDGIGVVRMHYSNSWVHTINKNNREWLS
jgi:hypothetical protein